MMRLGGSKNKVCWNCGVFFSRRSHLCLGIINHRKGETLGQIITPWCISTERPLGFIASSDNNSGFERPQSLISSSCYQRCILRRGGGQPGLFHSLKASILGIKGWEGWPRSGSDCCRRWQADGSRGSSDKEALQSSSQVSSYQGITNGYDMICLASLPIKACWGNVEDASPFSARVHQCSVRLAYCLSFSRQWRSKFYCDFYKGKRLLARPFRYVDTDER